MYSSDAKNRAKPRGEHICLQHSFLHLPPSLLYQGWSPCLAVFHLHESWSHKFIFTMGIENPKHLVVLKSQEWMINGEFKRFLLFIYLNLTWLRRWRVGLSYCRLTAVGFFCVPSWPKERWQPAHSGLPNHEGETLWILNHFHFISQIFSSTYWRYQHG